MERSIQKNGLINVLVLLGVAVAAFAVARLTNSLAGQIAVAFLGIGVLISAVSWFQMRLEDRERLEKLELDELVKSHGTATLFESKDAEVFPAQRSREQFERFFVPAFTIILFLAQAAGVYYLWQWLSANSLQPTLRQPMVGIALFGLFSLVLFLLGKFGATIARIKNNRLLRPGSSYVLLAAYISFFVTAGIVGVQAEFPRTDFYVARVLCVLLGLVAAETLIHLVLELYRPRVKGKIERPLYESRLVGLLGQPEGLITTAAQALDYQFGFKVSETWFYRLFVEKALVWLVLGQLAVLLLSTGVVFIEAGEQGLLERCGKPVEGRTLLDSGAHIVCPWPIDHVRRFRTEQIQSFEIGTSPEEHEERGPVLWTIAHNKEDNFLVANREPVSASATNNPTTKRTPPVSLLTGTIPVQFQITNLIAWAYQNEDSSSLLEDLARREIVRYLVAADMNEIMSSGRLEASQALAERIQTAADKLRLGAKILAVGLQDLHPPVKVAPDYEKVIGAIQTRQARILAARAEDIKTNSLAEAQATNILNRAISESLARRLGAVAQAALFTNQIPAYEAAPSVYLNRAYLQTFAKSTANARKIILLSTNSHDVLTIDLQDKIRADLIDSLNVAPPKTTK